MSYSNKIDLKDFFYSVKTKYCIIKLSEDFPNYYTYSDVDIFCIDMKAMIQEILNWGQKYVENFNFQIRVAEVNENQTHIDFIEKGAKILDFRFDLYGSIPKYKKISIKDSFFDYVLDHSIQNSNEIFVPEKINECLLRYFEFIEYYDIRADKIKHAEYIIKNLNEEEKEIFFKRLCYYTTMPMEVSKNVKRAKINNNIIVRFIWNTIVSLFACMIPNREIRHRIRNCKI